MSSSITIARHSEVAMTSKKRCLCGSNANVKLIAKLGRVRQTTITVYNVPVYSCDDCGYEFMTGSDSKKFALRVQEAYDLDKVEINFD